MTNRNLVTIVCLLGLAGGMKVPMGSAETVSWVIVGASLADGTGKPLRKANVRVTRDRITRVGIFKPGRSETQVAADGLVLAPGFIDIHNHSTQGLESEPEAVSQVSQGITTLVLGQDGSSPWPIADYLLKLRERPPAVNVVMLVGHATVRRQVMGDDYARAARPDEIGKMAELVEHAMQEGAAGLSSGLEYVVGSYATTDEVVSLARVAARYGGLYISHIRDEADRSFEAIRELITIGDKAGLPVQNTHIKLGTVSVWGKAAEAIGLLDEARKRGIDITADCYPYEAWQSNLKVLVPSKRWDDPVDVRKGLDDVGGAQNITVTEYRANREYEFKSLEVIAKARGVTAVELYIEMVKNGDAGVICKSMIDDDIRTFFKWNWTMVSSDGGIGSRHPRGAGTYPRVLGRFVRERKWLTLEEAVRKMTSLPAERLKLRDRGTIRVGMKADLVLFNSETVIDNATFAEPGRLATGIEKVFVNGTLVWDGKKTDGARPGRVLRK